MVSLSCIAFNQSCIQNNYGDIILDLQVLKNLFEFCTDKRFPLFNFTVS